MVSWDPPTDSGDSDGAEAEQVVDGAHSETLAEPTAVQSSACSSGPRVEAVVADGTPSPQKRGRSRSKGGRANTRDSISSDSSRSVRRADNRKVLRRCSTDDQPPLVRGCEYWQEPLWHHSALPRGKLPPQTRNLMWELACAGAGTEIMIAKATLLAKYVALQVFIGKQAGVKLNIVGTNTHFYFGKSTRTRFAIESP